MVDDMVVVIIDFDDVTVEVVEVVSAFDVFAVVVDTFFDAVDVVNSDAVDTGFDVVIDDSDVVFEVEVVDISELVFV